MTVKKRVPLAAVALASTLSGAAFAQGATGYVALGTRCEDVFTRSKAGLTFRPNVDVFAPAFLVSGKTLRTPVATCRMQKSSTKGEVREFQFECASSISYVPVKLFFRKGENDTLIRLASANETIGNRYQRCR